MTERTAPHSLVLASASPRRRRLLASLELDFEVRPVDFDERVRRGETPAGYVSRLAAGKAAVDCRPGEAVLAADTIVVLEGEVLGKPKDRSEARAMLHRLCGRRHDVLTGVALLCAGRSASSEPTVTRTQVQMAPMSVGEIEWYVATGEADDKAGSYAIQGLGSLFVDAIYGNYTNVVGLPIPAVYRQMAQAGLDLRDFRQQERPPPFRHEKAPTE